MKKDKHPNILAIFAWIIVTVVVLRAVVKPPTSSTVRPVDAAAASLQSYSGSGQ